MNKKIQQSLVEYGLNVTDKNTLYGVKNGYEITVSYSAMDNVSPVRIHIACYATTLQRTAIESALANRTDIKGVKKMSEFGLLLGLNDWTAGRMASRLGSILDWTLGMLNLNGALGVEYCPHCGKPLNGGGKKCNVNGACITLDDDCLAAANSLIDNQNQQFNEKPNNILRGTIGALIGGIAGALTAVLFIYLGYVSALSGIVAVGLGAFLYTKFGGKPNKIMILIVSVMSLACLIAAVYFTYVVVSGVVMSEELGFTVSGFDAFDMLMEVDDFRNSFYVDLFMVILFAAIGMGIYIWALWRKVKLNGKQQHITAQQPEQAQPRAEQPSANTNIDPFADAPQASQAQSDAVAEQAATDNKDNSEKM